MNKNISKIVLSLSAIVALSGCGTESSYNSSDNSEGGDNEITSNIGLTGYVLTDRYVSDATVCFDTNKNGICEASEDSNVTDANGYYSFSKDISSDNTGSLLIAKINENNTTQYVLSANQNSTTAQNITPYTTLVVNEGKYNLKVVNNSTTANAYLINNLANLDDTLLNGGDYLTNVSALTNAKSVIGSYETAYAIDATNPLLTIASVVDEMIKTNSYDVTVSSISTQEITTDDSSTVEDQFSLTSLNQTTSWEKAEGDEIVMGSDNSANKTVSYSKFHNRLTILDTTTKTQSATLTGSTNYLNVEGAEHTTDSISGATEQTLSKIELSSDGNTLYSLIKQYEDDSTSTGVGIYKTDISGGLPSELFARKVIGAEFYQSTDIEDIVLSSDDSTLVTNGDKTILVFDTDNLSTPTTTISTTKNIKSLAISDDNKYIFAGLYKRNDSSLGIYSVETQQLLGEYSLDDAPTKIEIGSNNDIFVGYTGAKSIFHLNIIDISAISLKNEFIYDYNIKSIKESEDKKLLIVATNSNYVQIRDISDTSRVTQIKTTDTVNNAFSLDADKIAVTSGTNIDYYNIINIPASVSATAVETWETTYRTSSVTQ